MIILDASDSTNWTNFAASCFAGAASIIAIICSFTNSKQALASNERNVKAALAENKVISQQTLQTSAENTDKTIQSKRIEERKAEIYKSLNDLYGPLFQLRKKSNLLYEKFKIGKSTNTEDGRFSTLLYLLANGGPNDLSANDQALLAEIISIGEECEKLILAKAGLIEDEELRKDWFPRATKHYLILRLAYRGSLKGDMAMYKDSQFPSEMDKKLEDRITDLLGELRTIS